MKAECPACKSFLSAVYEAMQGERDGGCPNCGLPGLVMREIERVRKAHADADLTAKLEAALVRAGKAEGELARLRGQLYRVRQVFAEWERKEPLDSDEWRTAEWPDDD